MMTDFMTAYKREPDAINEKGTKFWKANKWRGRQILYVETKDGHKTIIALDKKGDVIAEHQSLEAVAVKIDAIAIANNEDLTKG